MKYGIYADIHGNLDAARVVIEYLKEKVDSLVYVGDIVGYGPEPNECIKLIRESGSVVIAGNHDWACIGLIDINNFTTYAKEAILWTRSVLTEDSKDFLKGLDLVFRNDDLTAVHSSLYKPSEFNYVYDVSLAKKNFKKSSTSVCFIAHTHKPMVFYKNKLQYFSSKIENKFQRVNINSNYDYIFNVGSVGQPRDGNLESCCVIYDTEHKTVDFNRLGYPVVDVQKKIIKKGLPQFLSTRLNKGI